MYLFIYLFRSTLYKKILFHFPCNALLAVFFVIICEIYQQFPNESKFYTPNLFQCMQDQNC